MKWSDVFYWGLVDSTINIGNLANSTNAFDNMMQNTLEMYQPLQMVTVHIGQNQPSDYYPIQPQPLPMQNPPMQTPTMQNPPLPPPPMNSVNRSDPFKKPIFPEDKKESNDGCCSRCFTACTRTFSLCSIFMFCLPFIEGIYAGLTRCFTGLILGCRSCGYR